MLWTCVACASGGEHTRRDGGGPTGRDAGSVEPIDECSPPCFETEECVLGACVPRDSDRDGVPDDIDCDPDDPDVGRTAELLCRGCGGTEGLVRCSDGVWTPCDAPTDCACEGDEEPQRVSCERCGTRERRCESGEWVDDELCEGAGECVAGTTDTEREPCGRCGQRVRTRLCSDTCGWGEWSAWGECMGQGECAPGSVDRRLTSCQTAGPHTTARERTRACNPETCAWGAWMEAADCDVAITATQCVHTSLHTVFDPGGCTRSNQCCSGSWTPRAGDGTPPCGACACTDEFASTGCLVP